MTKLGAEFRTFVFLATGNTFSFVPFFFPSQILTLNFYVPLLHTGIRHAFKRAPLGGVPGSGFQSSGECMAVVASTGQTLGTRVLFVSRQAGTVLSICPLCCV